MAEGEAEGWAWSEFCGLVERVPEGVGVKRAFGGLVGLEERFGHAGVPLYTLLLKYGVLGWVEESGHGCECGAGGQDAVLGGEKRVHALDLRALFGIGGGVELRPQILTVVGMERVSNVQHAVETILAEGIPGDLVEAGVWRGGVVVFMAGMLHIRGIDPAERRVFAADSFVGLPDVDGDADAPAHPDECRRFAPGSFAVSRAAVEASLAAFGLLSPRVVFLEGWFADTLAPSASGISQVALLRLDGDLYVSTRDALDALYDSVVPGGFVIVDDYGTLASARAAVDDFRAARAITAPLRWIDLSGVFWRVEA